jgi:hypothetical protein
LLLRDADSNAATTNKPVSNLDNDDNPLANFYSFGVNAPQLAALNCVREQVHS